MSKFLTKPNHRILKLACLMITLGLVWFGLNLGKAQAASGINLQLNYQGKLNTIAGNAVTDSSWNFRFRIYDASTNGNLLWTERWTATSTQVTTVNGVFSVALGSISSLSGVDFNNNSLYLQVDLDANTNGTWEESFSSRKRLTSTPYAFNADLIDGIHATSTAAVANQLLALDSFGNLNLFGQGVSSTFATTSWLYVREGALIKTLNATTTNVDNLTVFKTGAFNWLSATTSLNYWFNASSTLASGLSQWYYPWSGTIAPTSSVGIYINASSTISELRVANTLNATSTNVDNLFVFNNATTTGNAMFSTDGDGVGIGTGVPGPTQGFQLTIYDGSGVGDAAMIMDVVDNQWYVGVHDSDDDKLKIGTGKNISSNTFATFQTNGYLGLGTASPLATFNVSGTTLLGGAASTTGTLVVNAPANYSGYITPTSTLTVLGSGYFTGNATTSGHFAASEICLGSDCKTSWPTSGSGTNDWQVVWPGTLSPTSTNDLTGIYINASSTIAADFRVDGSATTTKSMYVGQQLNIATTTPWTGYELAVTGNQILTGNFYNLGLTNLTDLRTFNLNASTTANFNNIYTYGNATTTGWLTVGTVSPARVWATGDLSVGNNLLADEDLYVGESASNDDDSIFFDQGGESIIWDNDATRFTFSDDVQILGAASTTGTLVVNGQTGTSAWAAPTNTLTVVGSGLFTGNATTSGFLSSVSGLFVATTTRWVNYEAAIGGDLGLGGNLYTFGSATTTKSLYIADTLGIATTSPYVGNKLAVTGNAFIAGNITASSQLISIVAAGTAPLAVSSNTKVASLNADLLDGFDSSAFGDATAANQTTILARIGQNTDAASMSDSLFAGQQYLADTIVGTTDIGGVTGSLTGSLAEMIDYVADNAGGGTSLKIVTDLSNDGVAASVDCGSGWQIMRVFCDLTPAGAYQMYLGEGALDTRCNGGCYSCLNAQTCAGSGATVDNCIAQCYQ